MVNFSNTKQLSILLPHTNKALKEVLKDLSPQVLEQISKTKDLSTLLDSLLRQSHIKSDSNALLREAVANNPTLKSLGNISNTLKSLQQLLKEEKTLLPFQNRLEKVVQEVQSLDGEGLKKQLRTSGVLLESRLKEVFSLSQKLSTSLKNLKEMLQQSGLLESDSFVKRLESLMQTQKRVLFNTEGIQAKEEERFVQKLQKMLEEIEEAVKREPKEILVTKREEKAEPLKALQKLLESVQQNRASTNVDLSQLKKELMQVHTLLQKALVPTTLTPALSGSLIQLQKEIQTLLPLLETNTLEESSKSFTSGEAMVKKALDGIMQEVQKGLALIDENIKESYPPLFKEIDREVKELYLLLAQKGSVLERGAKEVVEQDLKALLLQVKEEIPATTLSQQSEIIKHVDRLLLQIDYHQLISHLSNGTSFYIPFSWEELEEGTIFLQKDAQKEKSSCEIDLKLKSHGRLRLRLELFEENHLNLYAYSESETFRRLLKEHISTLKSALFGVGIVPLEMAILEPPKEEETPLKAYTINSMPDLDMGFEVKV